MNNLITFFIKHSSWFVFLLLTIASCVLLFKNNPYQQSVYLTSANSASATVYEGISAVTSYFHLKDINNDLQERNALLEMEVVALRERVNDLSMQLPDSLKSPASPCLQHYDFVVARVISNSIAQPYNYITINRGSKQGIKAEMGVVDQNGVVGIVNVVGPNSSRVISLLNSHMRLSCKLKNSAYFGSLVWDGKDPRYAVIEELPKHIKFNQGDTIVTSGYSAVFPEGLIVGTIVDAEKDMNDSFVKLRVALTTNFSQLSTVRVITNDMTAELKALQRGENGEDTTTAAAKNDASKQASKPATTTKQEPKQQPKQEVKQEPKQEKQEGGDAHE